MRMFIGIVLGICITVGTAYIYDMSTVGPVTQPAQGSPGAVSKPLVNWDVVSSDWYLFTSNVRHTWNRIAVRS